MPTLQSTMRVSTGSSSLSDRCMSMYEGLVVGRRLGVVAILRMTLLSVVRAAGNDFVFWHFDRSFV